MVRIIAIAFAVTFICGCSTYKPRHVKRQYFRMDTFTEITLVQGKKMNIDSVWNGLDSLLKDWEERFSQSHERSEILALNRRANSRRVHVSPVLKEILLAGLRYGDTLSGAFDISILPIKEIWSLGEQGGPERIPPSDSLAMALSCVDYRNINLREDQDTVVFEKPCIQIDLGGIAKGFVIRETDRYIKSKGFNGYLISAGGDILCRGRRFDNKAWKIGIQHPRNPDELLATITLDSGAIVTSGDYQRFWIKDGKRYHHIFDSKSGLSCWKNQSLTIWGMDVIEIDILSTGLFCLQADSIVAFVEKRPRIECVVVDSAGKVFASRGWKNKIKWGEQ
ncbi:MAG: FAD:protein FMN transferase [Elusimicrobiota bacterium]